MPLDIGPAAQELTDDEYTCLMIAAQGQSMIAIGRWEKSIDALVERGLMFRHDKANNGITDAGRAAIAAREQDDDAALVQIFRRGIETNNARLTQSRPLIEEVARKLVEAAHASRAPGDSLTTAIQRWGEAAIARAKELANG